MTYQQAIKRACQLAIETGSDWFVAFDADNLASPAESGTGNYKVSQDSMDALYLAEPCLEAQIIASS